MLPTEATLTLAYDLENAMPLDAPGYVKKAAERMLATADEVKQVFVERIEGAGRDTATEMAFDAAVDRFWASTREHLGYCMLYDLDALELLTQDQQAKLELDAKRERAVLARELDKHLFGAGGLKFLRKPFPQQVTLMASRLTFIDANDKAPLYQAVLGPELLAALNILQERYEDMVHARSVRFDSSISLRALRSKLQRHIQLYAAAVLTLLDDDEPESAQLVVEALQPMVNARVRRSRANAAGDEAEGPEEPNDVDTGNPGLDDSQTDADEPELEFDDVQTE